jgi:hypothetical protein
MRHALIVHARTVTQPRFGCSKWPFQSLKRSETVAGARFSNRFMKLFAETLKRGA